jgi:molecular chaperone GrpE
MWLDSKPTRGMLLEMVSILDGMERLVSMGEKEALEANPVVRNWLTSIRGLQRRMVRSLEKLGVKAIPSLGRPFDAHIHEAVEVRKDSRYPPGTVVEVREKPFRWGHQTLRVGKVVVTPKSPRISTSF